MKSAMLSLAESSLRNKTTMNIERILHKWLAVDGRTTVHVVDGCRAGWLDMSRDIFGVGNRQEHSALVEGAPGFFGSGRRSGAMQHEEGRPEIECVGKGVSAGGGTERGRNHLPAYVILHECRTQAVRENRSSETRNRLSVR